MPQRYTVIIPTFQRPDQLLRLLEHIREQVLDAAEVGPSFELIVVDDDLASPLQRTIEACDTPACRVTYLQGQGLGPGEARNAAATVASGDFLVFLDDDCEVSAQWLSTLAHTVADAPADVYYGRVDSPAHRYDPFVHTVELKDCPYRSTHMAMRRTLFEALGGFDPALSYWAEGWDLVSRARRHGAVLKYVPEWRSTHLAPIPASAIPRLGGYTANLATHGLSAEAPPGYRRGAGTPEPTGIERAGAYAVAAYVAGGAVFFGRPAPGPCGSEFC